MRIVGRLLGGPGIPTFRHPDLPASRHPGIPTFGHPGVRFPGAAGSPRPLAKVAGIAGDPLPGDPVVAWHLAGGLPMIRETTTAPPPGPVSRMVAVHPALREHFARPHIAFVDGSTGQDSWAEYPNGMVTIIVNVGEAFGGHPSAFVAGLTDARDVIERDGPIECLDLKLTPPGARRLLGVPLAELTGTVVALRDVLGPGVDEVADRFATQSTWNARAPILETAMLRRADDLPGVDRRIEWAWRRIVSRDGMVSIRRLADEVGWSQRHLISSFRCQLGLTPHKLARITRFNAVLPDLRDGTSDGASLAARYGYADQSHLIREVHEFTGVTPTRLAGVGRPVS